MALDTCAKGQAQAMAAFVHVPLASHVRAAFFPAAASAAAASAAAVCRAGRGRASLRDCARVQAAAASSRALNRSVSAAFHDPSRRRSPPPIRLRRSRPQLDCLRAKTTQLRTTLRTAVAPMLSGWLARAFKVRRCGRPARRRAPRAYFEMPCPACP